VLGQHIGSCSGEYKAKSSKVEHYRDPTGRFPVQDSLQGNGHETLQET